MGLLVSFCCLRPFHPYFLLDIDVEALESELAREEEEVSKTPDDISSASNASDRDRPPMMLGIDEGESESMVLISHDQNVRHVLRIAPFSYDCFS